MTEAQGVALLAAAADQLVATQVVFAALCACFGLGVAIIIAITWKG